MSVRIASLGMYDHPRQRAANDRLWQSIARILRVRGVAGVPSELDRSRPVQTIWRDPDLLFGQACGFPLVSDADLTLRVLALPVYDVREGDAAEHRSYLVTRRDDAEIDLAAYRGRRAAVNDRGSNTGVNLFRAAIGGVAQGGRFFGRVRETGSHRDSIAAILGCEADIAAIDAVTYAAIDRYEPDVTAALRILGTTVASPTPPFVTAHRTSVETVAALRMALADIMADPDLAETRETLFLKGIVPGEMERYAPLRSLAIEAASAGYPELV